MYERVFLLIIPACAEMMAYFQMLMQAGRRVQAVSMSGAICVVE